MCCCCGERGAHGWSPEHGRYHHGHGHHHEYEPHHHRSHYHDDGPVRPPEWDRGGECDCGGEPAGERGRGAEGERDRGGADERFNWNESYPFGFRRQFHARGEEVEFLQRYLDGLLKEVAAVREVIAQMQKPPEAPAPRPAERAAECCGGEPAPGGGEPAPGSSEPTPDATPRP